MFLALHEFDGEMFPEKEMNATGETEWSKKVLGKAERTDFKKFELLKGFGAVEAKY